MTAALPRPARRLRRTVLFTPGDRPDRIAKALGAGEADTLVMDWEDAVAPAEKPAAREKVREAWKGLPETRTERVIRVNGVATEWHKDDLTAAVPLRPDAIMIPKAERPEDVRRIDERITALEGASASPPGRIKLLLIVESALGVLNAHALATASPRVDALVFGAEDFQVDLGGKRRRDNLDVLYPRAHVAIAAAAARIGSVDQVFIDINDTAELYAEAGFALNLGYRGKMVIHPKQVPVVNQVFTPPEERIEWAEKLLEAAQAAEKEGKGTFAFEGKMIDRPLIEQAKQVMEAARQSGVRK